MKLQRTSPPSVIIIIIIVLDSKGLQGYKHYMVNILYECDQLSQIVCSVIAIIMHHKVNIFDTLARIVFLGGHPAQYYSPLLCVQCVCVCVRASRACVTALSAFLIAAHLGITRILFYQLTPLTLLFTVNSYNVTQII